MATLVNFNGFTYSIPAFGDTNWAQGNGNLSSYLIALANGSLTPSGGSFPLTADINFGGSFGLISLYYKSHSANIASAGVLRLSNTDTIDWRNFANSSNNVLAVDNLDRLTYNGVVVAATSSGTVNPGTANQIAYYPASTNAVSGLTLTPNKALITDGVGLPSASTTTATEIGFVSGVTSSIQSQINAISTGTIPSGTVLDFAGTSAPSGYYLCDGTSYPTAGDSALFTAIGYTWGGAGPNFNVPNLNRRVTMGSGGAGTGTIGNVVGNTGGEETHTLITAEVPSFTPIISITDPGHIHAITDPSHVHTERVYVSGAGAQHSVGDSPSTAGGTTFTATNPASTDTAVTGITVNSHITGVTASSTSAGGNGAHNNIQPAAIVLKIIKR